MVDETGMKSEKEGGENAVKKMMSLTENIFNLKFCSWIFPCLSLTSFWWMGSFFGSTVSLCVIFICIYSNSWEKLSFNGLAANINIGSFKDASLCDKSRLIKGSVCASEIIVYQIINMPYWYLFVSVCQNKCAY